MASFILFVLLTLVSVVLAATEPITTQLFMINPGIGPIKASLAQHCLRDNIYHIILTASDGANTATVSMTLTEGPSLYSLRSSNTVDGTVTLATEYCGLYPGSSASCTASVTVSAARYGATTISAGTSLVGSNYAEYPVTITAGAEKLNSPGGVCTGGVGAVLPVVVAGVGAAIGLAVLLVL